MDEQHKRRNASLWRYRKQKILSNKWAWIIGCISLLLAITCLIIDNLYLKCGFPIIKVVTIFIETISFGYLCAFIVYIIVTFLPSTEKEIDTKDKIYFQLYLVSKVLDSIYYSFVPQGSKVDFRICNMQLYNYLVKNEKITDLYDEDSRSNNPIIDRNHLSCLLNKLDNLNINIERTLASYIHDLKSDEIETLYDLSKIRAELIDSINENEDTFKKDHLKFFIDHYSYLSCIYFRKIYFDYSLYKYWEPQNEK